MPETPQVPEPMPDVPAGWTARPPGADDLGALSALRGTDHLPWTGSDRVDEELLESEVIGAASWTRRQAVVLDPDDRIRGWVTVHDRARGRTMLQVYLDRNVPEPTLDEVAASCYAWVLDRALDIARLHGLDHTRADASPFAEDRRQRRWLADAGYTATRTWLHLTRPVEPADAGPVELREGVAVRPVAAHANGMPVAADLQVVHRMLEESFQDHFNSYRESFPEFVQRLREDPSHRWDHWWLAFVEDGEGLARPAGTVVCSVIAPGESGRGGTYVEYIGVNRYARGRGVAKGLLATVLADALERGRDRVDLEVDADSPTKADELYRALGWSGDYVTESWFRELVVPDLAD